MKLTKGFMIVSMRNCGKPHDNRTKWRFLTMCVSVYAGLVLYSVCVPSVFCYHDRSSQLTYDQIYNDTNYPQINYRPRAYYGLQNHKYREYKRPNGREDEVNTNNVDYTFDYREETGLDDSLLVGFSYDPFRNSVPEPEYAKGVRDIKPQYLSKGERGKRGVVHLYNMIYCATGCEPLSYKGYGCYCGFLGSGRSMDGIDRCCKLHDRCYEDIYCPFFTVYFQPYYWKCHRGQPLCALENRASRDRVVNGCQAKLCECDRRFAMCLKKYRCPRGRALCTSSPLRLLQNVLAFP